ncbi:MAG: AIPR family protein [Dehalococcoidales bacterium]|nr:AIPR family protein [Dehalococcoidales bacterium]
MVTPSFWNAFISKDDLKPYGADSLLLFALQIRYPIEDISLVASNSLTEGGDDCKADLVYIDSESKRAIIAQTYVCEDMTKQSAPANKASDLNTAISWLLSRPIGEVPERIKSHAQELRKVIIEGNIKQLHFWYVHNLPQSLNVSNELKTVEHSALTAIKANFTGHEDIEVIGLEVGISTLEEWYLFTSTPIVITDEFVLSISEGFEITDADWKAYVTSIPAKWLYELYKKYNINLFSPNIRDYLGSREVDYNINNGIKKTAGNDPSHFWVYNNGITVLVNSFKEERNGDNVELRINGFGIINGAQTTGSIGTLDKMPQENAQVQTRFVKCDNPDTLDNIRKYNNSQNKITAPDFRSHDKIQTRLVEEFKKIPNIEYLPRRGGHADIIRRRPNALPSVTAGQALAAFHGKPDIAYHEKTRMWEDNLKYDSYFNDHTTARHIVFAYSLLNACEKKKLELWTKHKNASILQFEKDQLEFYRARGSTFMVTTAISSSLEAIIDKPIPNLFDIIYKNNISLDEATNNWVPIVKIASSFAADLSIGLADGFRADEPVRKALSEFQQKMAAIRDANAEIFSAFAALVN